MVTRITEVKLINWTDEQIKQLDKFNPNWIMLSDTENPPNCEDCGKELQLAKPEHQIDIGMGSNSYYDCVCHKLRNVKI